MIIFLKGAGVACLSFLLSTFMSVACAKGAGPIGIWAIDEQYAVVADKSIPGLVLVDLENNSVSDEFYMPGHKLKFVASCPDCDFLFVTGGNNDFLKITLHSTVRELIATDPEQFFSEATATLLDLEYSEGFCPFFCNKVNITDGRATLTSDDGSYTFLASSVDGALYRINTNDGVFGQIEAWKFPGHKPFGLNWGNEETLLVTMHKKLVFRLTRTGEIISSYDVFQHNCPGAREGKPNLRAALDAPGENAGVFVLASNPLSYDAVIWLLQTTPDGTLTCEVAAGGINRGPEWIDGVSENIYFSRPHYMIYRPATTPQEIVVSDIDNRALRLISVSDYSSESVFIGRGRRLEENPPTHTSSRLSCSELGWNVMISTNLFDSRTCFHRDASQELMTYDQAFGHCEAIGARLCDIEEISQPQFESQGIFWSSTECGSCWLRDYDSSCAAEIETFRTPDSKHGDQDFQQSWNSSYALVTISQEGTSGRCVPFNSRVQGSAVCCGAED